MSKVIAIKQMRRANANMLTRTKGPRFVWGPPGVSYGSNNGRN